MSLLPLPTFPQSDWLIAPPPPAVQMLPELPTLARVEIPLPDNKVLVIPTARIMPPLPTNPCDRCAGTGEPQGSDAWYCSECDGFGYLPPLPDLTADQQLHIDLTHAGAYTEPEPSDAPDPYADLYTDWFHPDTKPAYNGPYQIQIQFGERVFLVWSHDSENWFYNNGKKCCSWDMLKEIAFGWRGLTREVLQ